MTYPSPPWTLKGLALQTLQLVDRATARPFVPPELDIVSVLPGKTLGGVYLSYYGEGSDLVYSELIVIPALTRYKTKLGFWVSHIYVDNADSLAGGHEIWGLPKEMAQFDWQLGEQTGVTVSQGGRVLCSLQGGRQQNLWRMPISNPVFSLLNGDLLQFMGSFNARFGLSKGRVDVPAASPFAALGLGREARTLHYNDMRFVANAPKVIRPALVGAEVHTGTQS
ncbi:MAG: acetoacetate decarboxylase family protein [Bacillota bacterium]